MITYIVPEETLSITKAVAADLDGHFPSIQVFTVSDIPGEDHIYARNETGKPMFDMLISSSRKFVFVWYYIHPRYGLPLIERMKNTAFQDSKDFVVKFPNVPIKKAGWPSIVRWGKKPAGVQLEQFIIKAGNPDLEAKIFTPEHLNSYREYNWHHIPNALELIKAKAEEMISQRLGKNIDKLPNIRGMVLYAGCAYHYVYPHLGFGMRDIDVEVFFSPEWYTNTRCAFTRHCGIEEFGAPAYFGNKTRWLDLMWNSFHTETGNFHQDILTYMEEMRHKSDRWATISQRPMIDLNTKEIIYQPRWLKKMEEYFVK